MKRNITLTESQFNGYMSMLLNEAFGKKKTGNNSMVDRFVRLRQDEDCIRATGKTLFSNNNPEGDDEFDAYEALNEIIENAETDKSWLVDGKEYFTDEDSYVDEYAYQIGYWRMTNDGRGVNDENPYYAPIMNRAMAQVKANNPEKVKQNDADINAKIDKRNNEFDRIMGRQDTPALDYYNNVTGIFPINVSEYKNLTPEKLEEILLPYAENEETFKRFVNLRNELKSYDCTCNGMNVLIPVGNARLEQDIKVTNNGISFPKYTGSIDYSSILRKNLTQIVNIIRKNGANIKNNQLRCANRHPLVLLFDITMG